MKKLVLWFLCAVQLISASQKIGVAKCCSTSYMLLRASCKEQIHHEVEQNPLKDIEVEVKVLEETTWLIPVHSHENNRTKTADFHFNYDLIQCPDGYVVKHTLDFKLYNDGSLVTNWGNFPSGTFCLDQFLTKSDPEYVARFCVPDPCRNGYCMRKCCPLGMVINFSTGECEIHPKEFDFAIQNEDGSVVNTTDISIVDGATLPVCKNGINVLQPDIYGEKDEFYILPSGQLRIPAYEHDESIIDDFCIENFSDGNITKGAMICFPDEIEDPMSMYIYRYVLIVSSVFLMLTFMVYAVLPEIQNIHGVTVMCYVASSAVMYITFALIQFKVGVLVDDVSNEICIALAVIAHFTWLATFTWLNVMSFDIWLTFSNLQLRNSRPNGGRHRLGCHFLIYSIYAWGVPTLIVAVGQILDYAPNLPDSIIKPNFGVTHCWFKDSKSLVPYVYGPTGVIILINIILFISTAKQLYRHSQDAAFATENKRRMQKFRVIFSMFTLMGISWVMEIVSFVASEVTSEWIWIPTDIINLLTGFFVFVIFVCKRNVWNLLKKKWGLLKRLEKTITRNDRFTTSQRPVMHEPSTSVSSSISAS